MRKTLTLSLAVALILSMSASLRANIFIPPGGWGALLRTDLYIQSAGFVSVNSQGKVSVTVRKTGIRHVGPMSVRVHGSGYVPGVGQVLIDETQTVTLGWSGSATRTFHAGPLGHCISYSVSIAIDTTNAISETNEGNNWTHREYEGPCF